MANTKKETTNGVDLGELGMIRNILMGQQINEWEAQYNELQAEVKVKMGDLADRIKQLDKAANKDMATIQKELMARIEKMEKQITKKLDQLEVQLENTSARDQRKIGKLLSDMGNKLMEG